MIELGEGTIEIDEVFPITVADREVGIVFIESVPKAGSVGRTPPKNGGLSGGCGFADEGLRKVFAVESFRGSRSGESVEGPVQINGGEDGSIIGCLLYTSPSPRDKRQSRMPSSA